MGITVYNEGMGLFHSGSGGKGIAPGDVCLTPPPPPAGPLPVPYVNSLGASDLADGSETVKVDGNPTALEDKSSISTSTGNEPATQGGSVITHKTKGKGYFTMWSSTLMIEGKGADRHGDPMGQNCSSSPPSCVDMQALVAFQVKYGVQNQPLCDEPYDRKKLGLSGTTQSQKDEVYGEECWECAAAFEGGADKLVFESKSGKISTKTTAKTSGRKDSKQMTPDHQPPISTAWENGGCWMDEEEFKEWAKADSTVVPHCKFHSNTQGGTISGAEAKEDIAEWLDDFYSDF
jgi:uncharacterized Zn-binding protein involved in type VI secretion